MPGYSGYIPGAQMTIERNYFQVTKSCYERQREMAANPHHHGDGGFRANVKPRLQTAPGPGAAKFLPGYGGFVPGQRFKFETSEGTLAKTWAPRRGAEHHGSGLISSSYKPPKPRMKMRQDKYIVGYTGQLPGGQGEIEKSYARIARGVETGDIRPMATSEHPNAGSMAGISSSNYVQKAMPSAPPDYKLPGYTGYIPQVKYTFEQRYSAGVDAARSGVTGGAGFRFGGGTHLNRP